MKFLPTWDLSNLKNYTPGIWCHWPLGWDFPPTTAPGSVFWGLHTWRASGRFIDLRPRRWASEKPTAVLQGVAVVFFGGGEVLAYKFCKTKKYHMFLLAVSVNLGRFVMLFSVICYRLVSYYPSETLLNERLNQFGPFLSVFRVSMNYMILHGNQVSESTCMKLLFQVCILVHFFDYFRLGYSCLCCQTCGKKNNMKYSEISVSKLPLQTAKFAPWFFWVFQLFYFTYGRSTKSSTHYFHGSAAKTPSSWFLRDSRIPLAHGALAARLGFQFEGCRPGSRTISYRQQSIEFQKIHQQMCLETSKMNLYYVISINLIKLAWLMILWMISCCFFVDVIKNSSSKSTFPFVPTIAAPHLGRCSWCTPWHLRCIPLHLKTSPACRTRRPNSGGICTKDGWKGMEGFLNVWTFFLYMAVAGTEILWRFGLKLGLKFLVLFLGRGT